MIFETIVTTADGYPHIALMGVRFENDFALLAPFRPSTTLDDGIATGSAVVNFTTDVRVFAGCVTGYGRDWPTVVATTVPSVRFADTLAHTELRLSEVIDVRSVPRCVWNACIVRRMRRLRVSIGRRVRWSKVRFS